jgi:hypothetical protein
MQSGSTQGMGRTTGMGGGAMGPGGMKQPKSTIKGNKEKY